MTFCQIELKVHDHRSTYMCVVLEIYIDDSRKTQVKSHENSLSK